MNYIKLLDEFKYVFIIPEISVHIFIKYTYWSVQYVYFWWTSTYKECWFLFPWSLQDQCYKKIESVDQVSDVYLHRKPCLKLNLPRPCFTVPAAPRACNAMRPVWVHRSLRSNLLYWNTTRDQSEGLFWGLSLNNACLQLDLPIYLYIIFKGETLMNIHIYLYIYI